ncbi:MAG TPA: FGGY-family carbohydrate kinase [Propionibacteriaceae bacterium]|nr:FGGY-family carbohydrate kinase [Propionibacteriaceae bacterium]
MSDTFLLGVDFGTGGVRVGLFDTSGTPHTFTGVEYPTVYPRGGWAEQSPDVWWASFLTAARETVAKSGLHPDQIVGISSDTTASTVLVIGHDDKPLRPAIMWMDVCAHSEAAELTASGHPALKYVGFGEVSAEWGTPKALWLKRNEPETWASTKYVVDCNDWLTHALTGEWVASTNVASVKYLHDGDYGGYPVDLLASVGLEDFVDKVPSRQMGMGEVVGGLLPTVAEAIGLRPGTPVAMGGVDAYAGAIGLGVVDPGTLGIITGSSHVLIGHSAKPVHGAGVWGSFTDCIRSGQYTVESGQASTGSVVKWFKENLAGVAAVRALKEGRDTYDILTEEARSVPIGSNGLIWLDYFQGNRSPHTDPFVRGAIWGLELGHTPAHLFRGLLEGICYGTESVIQALLTAGFETSDVRITGGPARNPLWMQIHADVSNLPMSFTACQDGPSLGSAMVAAVGAGIYPDLSVAAKEMVHVTGTIEPNPDAHEKYQAYRQLYEDTYPALREAMHAMTRLQHDN